MPKELWEHSPLIQVNVVLAAVTLVGLLVSIKMVWVAIKRKTVVELNPTEEEIAKITMRRAVRQETAFLLVQALVFLVSLWSLLAVSPFAPRAAVLYYFGSQAARTLASIILCAVSIADLHERKRLARLIDALTPNTPPTKVG
jgi:hypothetical protein